ncbi:MAG TPA: metal-sulfur cluster assembly factor, partial [Trueperaceae bacterium]
PDINVVMTLTTPGCPMHGSIEKEVRLTLERLPGVEWVGVQIVWDPPWSIDRISEEGRRQLSWL